MKIKPIRLSPSEYKVPGYVWSSVGFQMCKSTRSLHAFSAWLQTGSSDKYQRLSFAYIGLEFWEVSLLNSIFMQLHSWRWQAIGRGCKTFGLRSMLRLDNTGAWAIGVYPELLCNLVSEHVDLYIKLKLVIFSFIWYYSYCREMMSNWIINLKVIFQLYFFPWA